MKKTYSKPDIFFEDFSLSTSIAAGCEEEPSAYSDKISGPCGVKWEAGVYLFSQNMNGCTRKVTDGKPGSMENGDLNMVDTNNNALCYHNPYESYNVFYS